MNIKISYNYAFVVLLLIVMFTFGTVYMIEEVYAGGGGNFAGGPSLGESVESSLIGNSCRGDCTPPTLGVIVDGKRIVDNGFSYNGNAVDVEYFYTPYPLITVSVGEENVTVLKIYEDQGPDNIKHVELAFGLGKSEIIGDSKAVIEWDRKFDGTETITVFDPENALEDVRVETNVGECGTTFSNAECLIVIIYHTFREPLDFNMVGTYVWDFRRNGWQNYFSGMTQDDINLINTAHDVGFELLSDGQYEDAIAHFKKVLELDSANVDVLNNIGTAFLYLENYDQAKEYFIQTLNVDPNNTLALTNMAVVLFNQYNYESSLQFVNKALEIDEENPNTLGLKSILLAELGRDAEADQIRTFVLGNYPDNTDALVSKSISLKNSGDYNQSLLTLDKALTIDPKHQHALIQKGEVLFSLSRYDESVISFTQAEEKFHNDVDVLTGKALSLIGAGDSGEAELIISNVQQIQHTSTKSSTNQAFFYLKEGDLVTANEIANEALTKKELPSKVIEEANIIKGDVEFIQKNFTGSIHYYSVADPDNSNFLVLYRMSETYVNDNDFCTASWYYEKASQIKPPRVYNDHPLKLNSGGDIFAVGKQAETGCNFMDHLIPILGLVVSIIVLGLLFYNTFRKDKKNNPNNNQNDNDSNDDLVTKKQYLENTEKKINHQAI